MPIITLTTDFGLADHYVAAVKGVLLSLAPRATLVDVTHQVARADVLHAAFVLAQLPATFPPGTVHLAVVDPTVGTRRAILGASAAGQFFIAPDNGLLTFVRQRWGLDELAAINPPAAIGRAVSETFHGRDIMAPAAATLATRGRLGELGPPVDRMELLSVAGPRPLDDGLAGQVIYIDHFGNCTTNIPRSAVRELVGRSPRVAVAAGGVALGPPRKTYADVPPGQPLALVGSAELLEVAVNLGSAAEKLGLSVGSEVTIRA